MIFDYVIGICIQNSKKCDALNNTHIVHFKRFERGMHHRCNAIRVQRKDERILFQCFLINYIVFVLFN